MGDDCRWRSSGSLLSPGVGTAMEAQVTLPDPKEIARQAAINYIDGRESVLELVERCIRARDAQHEADAERRVAEAIEAYSRRPTREESQPERVRQEEPESLWDRLERQDGEDIDRECGSR